MRFYVTGNTALCIDRKKGLERTPINYDRPLDCWPHIDVVLNSKTGMVYVNQAKAISLTPFVAKYLISLIEKQIVFEVDKGVLDYPIDLPFEDIDLGQE